MTSDRLHLRSLSIRGFLGIKELCIRRLGRVTLLAGRNGIGKTTVLDAVRVYAARGAFPALYQLLRRREEVSTLTDREGALIPDVSALFHGRDIGTTRISIGSSDLDSVQIEKTDSSDPQAAKLVKDLADFLPHGPGPLFRISFRGRESVGAWHVPLMNRYGGGRFQARGAIPDLPLLGDDVQDPFLEVACVPLGPGLLTNSEIAQAWDRVALTSDEELAVQSLKLVFGDAVERAAMIGAETHAKRHAGRRPVVKLRHHPRPVPLRSLGDGAVRLFGVAMALACSGGGLLVIDEAENGIHYTVHSDFWRMVLLTARKQNVQVLATTHSWDCVRGFAQAAADGSESDCALVRLDRNGEEIRAVEYSCEDLATAAEQGIEVR